MDLPQFALLTILLVVLSGVPEATSWRSNVDRSNGYDLQRGPVFYEAYYPDEQGLASPGQQISVNAQTERRYSDRGNILEKTYQFLEDSTYGIPYQRESRAPPNQRGFATDYDWPSEPSVSSESFLNTANESNEPIDHDTANFQAHKVAQQLERIVEGLEQDTSLRNSAVYSARVDDTAPNFHHPYSRMNNEKNLKSSPARRLDDSINIILSAIKNGALKISEEEPTSLTQDKTENMRVLSQERLIESDDFGHRSHPLMNGFNGNFDPINRSTLSDASEIQEKRAEGWSGNLKRGSNDEFNQISGDEYDDVRGPISGMAFRRMENIFQPRPQVISYVFSPTRTPKKTFSLTSTSEIPQTRSVRANERPTRNDKDNLITSEIQKESERPNGMRPGVASIEVSEVTHHKIRHHHGEKPRRNHQHRQVATRK